MSAQSLSLETIDDFLAQKRLAMVGISRDPRSFSATLFEELCRRGYDVIPVNPNAPEVLGRRCFARLQNIHPPVDAALLMTSPEITEQVVVDCAETGVHRVWMYRATGKGAVSQAAIAFCQERGIQVVPGQCPYMFLPRAETVHRLHGFLRKITGRYPQHTCA
jgi:predicted CoA-binding protein